MSEHVNGLSRRTFLEGSALVGAAFLMSINPLSKAFAVSSAEKQAEADAVREELIGLQAELEASSEIYYKALDEEEQARASMEEAQGKIDEANTRIESLQKRLGKRANSMYRSGPLSAMDFLLGSASFSEFARNWDLLDTMNESDSLMVDESKRLRAELHEARDEYARQEKIAAEKAEEAAVAKAAAESRVAEATELMNSLDEEARELLEQEQAAAAAAAAAAATSYSGTPSYSQNYVEVGGPYSDVVSAACSRIGCPYVWGAEGPYEFDCSGLVRWAYLQIGMSLPHYTESLYACATNRVPVSEARPGDVLYRAGHVGIAIGYGGVPYVHAPTFGACVRDTDSLSWSGFTHALQF